MIKRPNVLLLYTDQQRWDTLAAAGFPHMRTPNLDRLAARGALFDNAFCNNPVCMPSRQSMLSGRYPLALGTGCNGVEMPADVPTLATILGGRGYATANLGKLHFLNHATRDHRRPHPAYGFDEAIISDEPGCYEDPYIAWVRSVAPEHVEACRCSTPAAWQGTPVELGPRNTHQPYAFKGPDHLTHSAFVAEMTVDFLRRHTDGESWMAIAGFFAPHCPVNPPQRCVDLYTAADMPAPLMTETQREHLGLSDDQWREVRRWYAALVSHVDEQIGRILDELSALGLADDTLIIFTSDHGEHLGDHGRVQKGPPGFDSCVHVPLIVAGPGIAPGGRCAHGVEAVDLAPTVLDFCGVPTPPEMRGRSLHGWLTGGDYAPRTSTYMEFRNPDGFCCRHVRTPQWKYCVDNTGGELLFDLAADPGELTNLAQDPEHAAALAEMRQEMIRRIFDADGPGRPRTGPY